MLLIWTSDTPTNLHNDVILSILGISFRDFTFGSLNRPHTNGDSTCRPLYTYDHLIAYNVGLCSHSEIPIVTVRLNCLLLFLSQENIDYVFQL